MYILLGVGLYFHWHSRRLQVFPVRIAGACTFALMFA